MKFENQHRQILSLIESEQWDHAKIMCEDILRLNPNCAFASYLLGSIAYLLKDYKTAIFHQENTFMLDPQHHEAIRQLAWSYLELQEFDEALIWCNELLKLKPDDVQANYNQGVIYSYLKKFSAAQYAFTQTLTLDPNYIDAHINLCAINLKLENTLPAIEGYKKLLHDHPKHPIASYMLAALTQQQTQTEAPATFVSYLYDQYAPRYEHSMVQELEFKVPDLLFTAIQKIKFNSGILLDLGCGTGLTGARLKSYATQLIGVDLSAAMLSIARSKKIYDSLHHSSFHDYLKNCNQFYDLIYAADSLIYTGDLTQLFAYIAGQLAKNGYFIFSIEINSNAADYYLTSTGRYQHHPCYIEKLTEINNFKLVNAKSVIIRSQKSLPVKGIIYILTVGPYGPNDINC